MIFFTLNWKSPSLWQSTNRLSYVFPVNEIKRNMELKYVSYSAVILCLLINAFGLFWFCVFVLSSIGLLLGCVTDIGFLFLILVHWNCVTEFYRLFIYIMETLTNFCRKIPKRIHSMTSNHLGYSWVCKFVYGYLAQEILFFFCKFLRTHFTALMFAVCMTLFHCFFFTLSFTSFVTAS